MGAMLDTVIAGAEATVNITWQRCVGEQVAVKPWPVHATHVVCKFATTWWQVCPINQPKHSPDSAFLNAVVRGTRREKIQYERQCIPVPKDRFDFEKVKLPCQIFGDVDHS